MHTKMYSKTSSYMPWQRMNLILPQFWLTVPCWFLALAICPWAWQVFEALRASISLVVLLLLLLLQFLCFLIFEAVSIVNNAFFCYWLDNLHSLRWCTQTPFAALTRSVYTMKQLKGKKVVQGCMWPWHGLKCYRHLLGPDEPWNNGAHINYNKVTLTSMSLTTSSVAIHGHQRTPFLLISHDGTT